MRIERHDGTSVDLEYMLKLYLDEKAWQTISQTLNTPRYGHYSFVNDNKIYVVGGVTSEDVHLSSMEYLDLNDISNGWQTTGQSLNIQRSYISGVIHKDKVYIIGGKISSTPEFTNTIEYLDLKDISNGWQIMSHTMNQERYSFDSVVYKDKIYVFYGDAGVAEPYEIEYLDLNDISNGWQILNIGETKILRGHKVFLKDNLVYRVGGKVALNASLNFSYLNLDNPTGWIITYKTLKQTRFSHDLVFTGEKVYIYGGSRSTMEIFDFNNFSNGWQVANYAPTQYSYTSSVLYNNKIYMIPDGNVETFDLPEIYLATGNIPNTELLSKITVPTGFGKEVDMVNCSGGSNSVNLEVFNENEVFSKFIAEKNKGAGLYKRKCELYQVTSNNKTLLFTGVFNSYKPVDYKGMKYQIQIADYMSEYLEKETLFYNGYDADGVRIYAKWWDYDLGQTYEQNIAIKPANDDDLGVIVDKYLNSDSAWEVKSLQFEYDQLDPNNSTDAERMTEITQEIKEIREEDDYVISLKGHPLNVARFLIKQMFNVNATWNETSWSLAQADTDEVVLNKSVFELNEYPSNVMDYMSENIFRVCNVYPYINKNGELCIRKQKSITALQDIGLYTITRNEMIDIKPMTPDYNKVINHVMIKRGTKNVKEYFTNSESIINHGMKFLPESFPELVIPYVEIDGVPNFSNEEVVSISEDIKDTLFRMFATTYHEWELTVSMTDFSGIEIMDTVALQNELLIDPETGIRGFDESVESLDIYATWNNDVWGEYLGTYEGQQVLDANLDITTYSISEIISDSWYNSIENANINNSQYADDVVL